MESGWILLFAAILVFMAPGARGSSHLSFANNTEVNITRTGCNVAKTCLEMPTGCDPAGNGTCLFGSVALSNPTGPDSVKVSTELRGNSMGYVAVGITANASEGMSLLYLCAQNASNNGSFFFRTMGRNNTDGTLSPAETPVTEIRGSVNGDVIRCEFDSPTVSNISTAGKSLTITVVVLLGTGNITGDTPGPFNVSLNSGPLTLTIPLSPGNTTTTAAPNATTTANTTATATTTGGANMLHSHAWLLLLLVVGVATVFTPSLSV